MEVDPTGNECEEGEPTLITLTWTLLTLTLRAREFLGGCMGWGDGSEVSS